MTTASDPLADVLSALDHVTHVPVWISLLAGFTIVGKVAYPYFDRVLSHIERKHAGKTGDVDATRREIEATDEDTSSADTTESDNSLTGTAESGMDL
jgi:hypothetical protein